MKNFIKVIFLIFLVILPFHFSFSAINFREIFPNNLNIFQSMLNGWVSPFLSTSKEIETPEGCRKITSTNSSKFFIPTRTFTEWLAFKNNLPNGVSVGSCVTNGVCGSVTNLTTETSPNSNLCSEGTPGKVSSSSPNTWNWVCNGSSGGSNTNCSSGRQLTCTELNNVPLLRFNGNIDHILTIFVKVVTDSGEAVSVGGHAGHLAESVKKVGGEYREVREGWHGDLWANIRYTPIKASQLEKYNLEFKYDGSHGCGKHPGSNWFIYLINNGGLTWEQCVEGYKGNIRFKKIAGSVPYVTVTQQPTKENGWVAQIDFYTPGNGEQWIDGELYLNNLKCK